ncbi:E3 ubiquitin-protein ligase SIAH1 [Blattella germanica]|nr:E3 ubiquitin-protein ligase SIAH1 [Blattella germanica]
MMEDLLSQIECPVCWEYMAPPITMCTNGHNICNNCRPRLRNCPTCRGWFQKSIRNFTAEIVSRNITHSCRYKTSGCTAQLTADYKWDHEEEVCRYRPLKCPLFMMGCCEFAGQLGEMLHHVTVQHIQHPEITVYKFSTTLILNKTHPDSEIYNQVAFRILGDVFFLRWNTKKEFLYLTLLFVGEKEDASDFVYEASLHSLDGVGRMSARQQCRSYLELIDDQVLIKKIELCMAFPLSFVEQCVEEGQVRFIIELFNDST